MVGWERKYHGDIFRHVRYIQNNYREQIKQRFEELGRTDWLYEKDNSDSLQDVYLGRKNMNLVIKKIKLI
jgi:hypothetical protein